MPAEDRVIGFSQGVAYKAPVKVATTADITLSGAQTVDGVPVVALDRVLVKDQTDQTENGIYEVQTSGWTRAKDFNDNRDVIRGTVVYTLDGTANSERTYRVTTTDNPVVIGTSNITFTIHPTVGTPSNWLGDWVTATPYAVNDIVANGGGSYICILAHTSSATDEPGQGASWTTYWDIVAQAGTLDSDGLTKEGSSVASATTTDIGAADSNFVRITGTTTITGFGSTLTRHHMFLYFADALTLTHNATSLILPGGVNITTAANDRCEAIRLASGNGDWMIVNYQRASGAPVTTELSSDLTPQLGGALDTNAKQIQESKGADIASATALPILTDGNFFDVTGTTTITSFNTTGKFGTEITLQFDGILTLTHHATDLILPGAANITTAVGDVGVFREYASGDYVCVSYSRADGTPLVSSATGTLIDRQVFTSSGTWTKPAGCTNVVVTVVGGGGGGNGSIGNGGAGGTSSFGSHNQATGGGGGAAGANGLGGAGGIGSSGDVNSVGQDGGTGFGIGTTQALSGFGGSSTLGGGGSGKAVTGAGTAGNLYGGGGGGYASFGSSVSGGGGGGGGTTSEHITSGLGSTETITVGAGGAGGSGVTGAVGAAGIVIIEAYT